MKPGTCTAMWQCVCACVLLLRKIEYSDRFIERYRGHTDIYITFYYYYYYCYLKRQLTHQWDLWFPSAIALVGTLICSEVVALLTLIQRFFLTAGFYFLSHCCCPRTVIYPFSITCPCLQKVCCISLCTSRKCTV